MKRSALRHPVAVLRKIIGLGQKELAALAGCSTPTIQSIELNTGRLTLSRSLAERIAMETGIDAEWLLANDVTKPPVTPEGKRFTKEHYEETRALTSTWGQSPLPAFLSFVESIRRLGNLLLKAHKDGKGQLCAYKLSNALDELSDEFRVGKPGLFSEAFSGETSEPLTQAFMAELMRVRPVKGNLKDLLPASFVISTKGEVHPGPKSRKKTLRKK